MSNKFCKQTLAPIVNKPLKCFDFILLLYLVCSCCDTSYIVSVYIPCQASIYTLSLCRGHSWWVRLAKQETRIPPGHLVSPLVCRGRWMSTVVLYCWCHSDSASVLMYLTYKCFALVWHGLCVLTQFCNGLCFCFNFFFNFLRFMF